MAENAAPQKVPPGAFAPIAPPLLRRFFSAIRSEFGQVELIL